MKNPKYKIRTLKALVKHQEKEIKLLHALQIVSSENNSLKIEKMKRDIPLYAGTSPPEVQQIKKEPEVQQSKKEPEVQQIKKEPEVQQIKKEPEVQQIKKEPEVQQSKKEPEVQQSKKEPEEPEEDECEYFRNESKKLIKTMVERSAENPTKIRALLSTFNVKRMQMVSEDKVEEVLKALIDLEVETR